MTAWFITVIVVLGLLLKPAYELRCTVLRQRNKVSRKERKEEMFAVNPHRQRKSSRRSRFFRTMFLMKQNDQKFNDNTKFIYGTIFELDNSHIHTDTTQVIAISAEKWEAAVLGSRGWSSSIRRAARKAVRKVSSACSLIVRRTRRNIRYTLRTVTKHIHNTGGEAGDAQNQTE